jgi:glycerol-3-phosphate dehydrogenase
VAALLITRMLLHLPTRPSSFWPQLCLTILPCCRVVCVVSCCVCRSAVPVQHSRSFLASIKDVLPKDVPIICVSKGLEVGSGCMMSEVIPSALGRKQPAVFLSGPSFAKEVRDLL